MTQAGLAAAELHRPGRKARRRGQEQRDVECIALVAVLGFQDAERAMVVRVLIEIQGKEGEDAGDRRSEGGRGGDRQQGPGTPAQPGVGGNPDGQGEGAVEAPQGRGRRQRRQVAGQALGVLGKEAAAAGGDHVGPQARK